MLHASRVRRRDLFRRRLIVRYCFQIDIAFANIWIMYNHYKFINMSQAWYQLSIQFLVPRPRPITNFWALTRPFSVIVWLLLLIMLFANSVYLFVRARIDPKFPKRKLRSIDRRLLRVLEYYLFISRFQYRGDLLYNDIIFSICRLPCKDIELMAW